MGKARYTKADRIRDLLRDTARRTVSGLVGRMLSHNELELSQAEVVDLFVEPQDAADIARVFEMVGLFRRDTLETACINPVNPASSPLKIAMSFRSERKFVFPVYARRGPRAEAPAELRARFDEWLAFEWQTLRDAALLNAFAKRMLRDYPFDQALFYFPGLKVLLAAEAETNALVDAALAKGMPRRLAAIDPGLRIYAQHATAMLTRWSLIEHTGARFGAGDVSSIMMTGASIPLPWSDHGEAVPLWTAS